MTIKDKIISRLDEDAAHWKKLWSMRFVVGFFVLNGIVVSVPLLSGYVNPWVLTGVNMVGFAAIGIARIWHQDLPKMPGL